MPPQTAPELATLTDIAAEQIYLERTRQRISARELAKRLGVGPNWVSERESRKRAISIADLEMLAPALNTTVAHLLGLPAAQALPPALQEVMDLLTDTAIPTQQKRVLLTVHRRATQMWREMLNPPSADAGEWANPREP